MDTQEIFFNFSFHDPGGFLLAFIPALINIVLIIYMIKNFPKNKITNIFILFALSLFFWQINDSLSRVSVNAKTADYWDCIFSIAWIFVAPLCLLFALLYTNHTIIAKSRLLNIVLFSPAIIFTALYQGRFYEHNYQYSPFWGWLNYHNQNIIDKIQIYWITLQVLAATILLFCFAYKTRKNNQIMSQQAAIIAVGIAIPAVAGIITQVILPLIFNSIAIPLASAFMSFFSLATVLAFRKYQLFTISELINTEQLMDNMPVMVFSISPQFHLTYINPIGIKNLSVTLKKTNEKHLDDLISNAFSLEKEKFIDAINTSMDGKEIQNMELAIKKANGERIDTLSSFIPIFNNSNIQGTMIVARDISDLKKSFQIISHQQELLKEAQQISQLGSWEWDIKNNKVTWSDELYRIYGYEPGEFDVSFEKFIECVHPDDKEMTENIVRKAMVDHKPFAYIHRSKHPDGKTVIISAIGRVELDENNIPYRMTGTGQDVTDAKKNEELLKKQNEELIKANKELDRFVYSTSHDLRAPLKSLLGLADIIKEDIESGNTVQKEQIEMMEKSVIKLDNFIEVILQYSRNTRLEVAKDIINFNDLIKEIQNDHEFIEKNKGLKVKIQIHQEDLFISDKRRVNVILSNLISNAFKYQDSSKEQPMVNVSIQGNKEKVIIIIEDNGIGIADKDKDKIFEMFYRATKLSSGSGLGLYIVSEALEKLNGTIQVESELNKGTKFIVTLPSLIETN